MSYQEWTYHGIRKVEVGTATALHVEEPATGFTDRRKATVVRSLRADDAGWGYNGTGTSNAAARILADALEIGDPDAAGIGILADEWNETLRNLCEDFCDEVLMQMAPEWWMSRTAVLRWVLGWYTQLGISPMPVVLRRLPPPGTVFERRLGLPPRR